MIGKFITVTRKVTTFQDEIHCYEEKLFGMDIWIFQREKIASTGEHTKKLEPSGIAGGNKHVYDCCGKVWWFFKKLNITI